MAVKQKSKEPTKYVKITSELRNSIKIMASYGLTAEQISWALPVPLSAASINQHCHDEMKEGRNRRMLKLAKTAYEMAEAGDKTMLIFLLKTKGGFHSRGIEDDNEDNINPSGVSINIELPENDRQSGKYITH